MSNCILFSIPGNEKLGHSLTGLLHAEDGKAIFRHPPGGETYVEVISEVWGKEAIIVCSLHHPDSKILSLYFLAKTLKEFRASSVTLVAPYFAYMRQDKRFANGECISSSFFSQLISGFIDKLITIDPNLHVRNSLSENYSIHVSVVDAKSLITTWIKNNIDKALLIGDDGESEQWVSEIAKEANTPFIILDKLHISNTDVKVSVSKVEKFMEYTPVLVGGIISNEHTMFETVGLIKDSGMKPPVCIGIHAVMPSYTYAKLKKAGAGKIVTCNSIVHPSNAIEVDALLADEVCRNCFVIG